MATLFVFWAQKLPQKLGKHKNVSNKAWREKFSLLKDITERVGKSLVNKTDSGTSNNTCLNNFEILNIVFKKQFKINNFEIDYLIGILTR